ncbi:MAG: hypothetical protein ABSA84_02495 [Gammaproteobacteria bacterium]
MDLGGYTLFILEAVVSPRRTLLFTNGTNVSVHASHGKRDNPSSMVSLNPRAQEVISNTFNDLFCRANSGS